jgi:uncharacterized membrane protein YedE/YeeE
MVIGVAGGLIVAGLVAGGMFGSILIAVVGCIAGIAVALGSSWLTEATASRQASKQLAQYPTYKY